MKKIPLKKCLSIFLHAYHAYNKKKDLLDSQTQTAFDQSLKQLKEAIANKDKHLANQFAKEIKLLEKKHLPSSNTKKTIYGFAMLCIALLFAVIIRQSCFELMEIPTGSMRPNFRECDRLIVSKSHFGINVPLTPKHFTFSPEEMKRGGTVVITGENMDIPGVHTKHFHIIPGVKKFLKRTIGLPGDRLYFYGGKIYGIDKDGNDISHKLQQDVFKNLEHIPFIHISGRLPLSDHHRNLSRIKTIEVEQNHQKLAKLTTYFDGSVQGKMLVDGIKDIYQLWGMENYGMTRIVSKENLIFSASGSEILATHPNNEYFLEITHHSSILNAKEIYDYRGVRRPIAGTQISYLPLNKEILQRIWNNLYTSRFNSNKGYLEHFGQNYQTSAMLKDRPKIKGGLSDGTYEFFDGVAYKLKGQFNPFGMIPSLAIPHQVAEDSPLSQFSIEKCITLYNMGIEQSNFRANNTHFGIAPSRYGYFRNGDFYLMGKKILSKHEEVLEHFISIEKEKGQGSVLYQPFIDNGAPINPDGSIDKSTIEKYGLKVPDKHYYVLGDNHAQSGDSREFGFVPEDNIRGITSFLLWAPGGRFGSPAQVAYSFFTIHKLVVWTVVLAGFTLYLFFERKRRRIINNTPYEELNNLKWYILLP